MKHPVTSAGKHAGWNTRRLAILCITAASMSAVSMAVIGSTGCGSGSGTRLASVSQPVTACNVLTNSGGGQNVINNVHELGRTQGTFTFSWDSFAVPDRYEVLYEGTVIFDTGNVSGSGTQQIVYGPGATTRVTVRTTGQAAGTLWRYTVGCPQ